MGTEVLAALGALFAIVACFGVIFYVVYAIGLWKTFEKMGLEGWKAIVPFYNDYTMADKTWEIKYILYLWGAIVAVNVLSAPKIEGFFGVLLGLIVFAANIILIVLRARFCYYIAKAFGYDIGFAVGLFFIPFVFTLILGFGQAKYVGNYYRESGAKY